MEKLMIIAQVVLGLFFLFNGLNHFMNRKLINEYAYSKKVWFPEYSVIVTGLILLFGGLSITFGMYLDWGLGLLILFLLTAAFWVHSFWADKDKNLKMVNMVNFLKNIALAAALVMLLGMQNDWPWQL